MTDGVFNEFMRKLDSYYSPKAKLDSVAMEEYQRVLSPVDDKFAKTLYAEIVRMQSFFPKIAEMKISASRFSAHERHENAERCYFCMDTGKVAYFKKGIDPFPDYEYEYASRCMCEAGKNKVDWPLCTSVITQGELEWVFQENYKKFSDIPKEESKKAKSYVQRFVKSFCA